MPALVEAFLAREHATNIKKIVGTMRGAATFQGTLPGESVAKAIEIVPEKSADALADLAANKCDVALASIKVNDQQAQMLRGAGVGDMTSKDCEHIVALDALAIVVHPSNPITEITKEQLAGVFGGQIGDWGQVKGSAGRINVYHEADESEDSESFRSLVSSRVMSNTGKTVGDGNAVSDSVSSDPGGIGFVGPSAIGNAKVVAVSSGGGLALLPNQFEIATEDYILSRRIYLYTSASSPNEWIGKFVNFATSKAGQEVVETTRFVAMRPRTAKRPPPPDAPVQYKSLTSNSERLDVNFRFRTGSDQLDNKALLDLGRVVELLRNPAYERRFILLFGFTDSTGPESLHPKLSQARAATVAAELQKNGIKPAVVTGFGEKIPVDSNDTEQGREKNRRVEVWLRQ